MLPRLLVIDEEEEDVVLVAEALEAVAPDKLNLPIIF